MVVASLVLGLEGSGADDGADDGDGGGRVKGTSGGLVLLSLEDTVIRQDESAPIRGLVVVVQKAGRA